MVIYFDPASDSTQLTWGTGTEKKVGGRETGGEEGAVKVSGYITLKVGYCFGSITCGQLVVN